MPDVDIEKLYPKPWSLSLEGRAKRQQWVIVDKDGNHVCTPHGETMGECRALGEFILSKL